VPKILVQLNSLALGGSQINAVDLAAATAEHGYDQMTGADRIAPVHPRGMGRPMQWRQAWNR
jgi:hypothetical protein